MSEVGVYPSIVPSFVDVPSFVECSFLFGDVEFESPHSRFILGVEVARCNIGVVRGVVQVVQNCFTGIPNPSRSSRLG